ncbi:MAG: homocysteine S-methyltransferase family protein, partial [Bacteroidota bacterium]|nr:homocysteine S-methyltransferase family protein [Bacteroidota bacterium]
TALPTGAYANTGNPEPAGREEPRRDVDIDGFTAAATACVDDGARIAGGCCGSTAAHILDLTRHLSPDTLRFQEEEQAAWLEARRNRYNRPTLPDEQNFT